MKPLKMEVFNDPSHYDMWAVRPVGVRDFNQTVHFDTEHEARFAAQCFEAWTKLKVKGVES
jgi:hypothetical protein